jgi:predicted transcriptional regulator
MYRLYIKLVINLAKKGIESDDIFTILVGGDMDEDHRLIFSGKIEGLPKNILYLDTFEELNDLLSPKKMELLRHLMMYQRTTLPKSISIIAKDIGRFQEAISKDIKYLKKLGLVEIVKEKQCVYPYPKFREIVIKTR